MVLDIKRDPVLRLLPEDPPDSFLRLPPEEQARRGRLWLVMYGAGYDPVHAWWFVTQPESDIGQMLASIKDLPDEELPKMLQGRATYEAGRAMEQSSVEQ